MKILFVTQTLDATGSEIVLSNILHHCDFDRFKLGVFVCHKPGLLIDSLPQQVELHTFSRIRKRLFYRLRALIAKLMVLSKIDKLFQILYCDKFLRKLYTPGLQHALLRIFIKGDYDILYFNTIMFPELMLFAANERIPYLIHSHELPHMLVNIPISYLPAFVNRPKKIITTSAAAMSAIRDLRLQCPVTIWKPALDLEILRSVTTRAPNKDLPFHWMGTGNNDLNKNMRLFLKVARHVLDIGYKARFTWVGMNQDNLFDYWLQNQLENLDLRQHVTLLRKQKNDATYYSMLATADAMLIPSYHESFSLTALEGIFLGAPVLTFANGGHAEYLSDLNGIVAENYSEQDFCAKAVWLMQNYHQFDRAKMRTTVENFDIRQRIRSWEAEMESIS